MLQASEEVIVVADSTKFGHQSLAHLCALERVDYLVVDHEIDPVWKKKVKAAGVELVVAEPPDAQLLKNA
jgi:DeoR/GlpR family transcriptional regulator of sugar metabolism